MTPLTKATFLFILIEMAIAFLLIWIFEGNPFDISFSILQISFLTIILTGILHHHQTDAALVDLGIVDPTEEHFKTTYSTTIQTAITHEDLLSLVQQENWLKAVQLSADKQEIVAKTQKGWSIIKLHKKEHQLLISSRMPIPISSIGNIKNVQRIEKIIKNASSS